MTPRQAALWSAVLAERPMISARVRQRVHGEDANDAVQEVLIRAARAITAGRFIVADGVDVTGAVRAWLTVILKRTCRGIRHVEASEDRKRLALPPEDMFVDPVPRLEAREELRHVPRGLTKHDRATLDVFARNGGSVTATAAEMGLHVGTVATRLRGIRAYLKKRRALDK